jgi:phage gpG-like protein
MTGAAEIVDDKEVLAALGRLMSFGRDPRRALQGIGRYGKSSTQMRFRNQRGPDFQPWKPSKRAIESKGQTLRKTGLLRNSITWQLTSVGVEWGTNVKYGAIHQFGFDGVQQVATHWRRLPSVRVKGKKVYKTTRTGAQITYQVRAFSRHMKMPARPFLGVNDIDRASMMAIVREEMIRQTGHVL